MQRENSGVRIICADRRSIILEEVCEIDPPVSVNWYNPLLRRFTNVRNVRILKQPIEELERYLCRKDVHIYTIADNLPVLSEEDKREINAHQIDLKTISKYQRVLDGEVPYIDEFGRYVYIACRLGPGRDQDLRYEGDPEGETFDFIVY